MVRRHRRPHLIRLRVRRLARALEGDPHAQYHVHKWMTRFWIVNLVAVLLVYSLLPHLWQKVSVLYLVLVSLYANIATDSGAAAAANASTDETITKYEIEESSQEPRGSGPGVPSGETG